MRSFITGELYRYTDWDDSSLHIDRQKDILLVLYENYNELAESPSALRGS